MSSSQQQQQQQQQNSDDIQQVLAIGTEVSAKFKGAFCEAKIKKIDRNVKCKITFKNTNDSQTINEAQILCQNGQPMSALKLNATVYAMNSGVLKPAFLNKIIDQSIYTVVFNDGDVKTLRRSFIRFKGEKHFLDSETLNNAPLNNPEHFLYPIKNKLNDSKRSSSGGAQSDNEEDNSESKSNRTRSKSQKRKEAERKPSKKQETKKEVGERGAEPENESDATNSDSNDDDDENDYSEENSSDDYPPEEKDRFVAQLYKFMDDRATPLNKIPTINKTDLDLHRVFIVVKKFGGFNKVTKQKLWLDVYKRLGLYDANSTNVLSLKCAYKRYLQPYEDFYRKLGSTVCDLPSLRNASSSSGLTRRLSSTDSHRQLFKPRYLTASNTLQQNKKPFQQQSSNAATSSKSKQKCNEANNNDDAQSTLSSSVNTPISEQVKRSHSQENEQTDGKELLTLESLAASQTTSANNFLLKYSDELNNNEVDDDDERLSQHQEELTLSSLVKKIKKENDSNFNSLKKGDSATSSSKSSTNQKSSSINSSISSGSSSSSGTKQPKSRRLSVESQKPTKKSKSEANNNSNNQMTSDELYDGEDEEDEQMSKSKKKIKKASLHRSAVVNEDEHSKGVKRKNSLNNSMAKNLHDDENDDENKDESLNDDTALTIHDLDVNKVIQVKYGNGKQLYDAKVVEIDLEKNRLLVHYHGWNSRYDEWIELSRINKIHGQDFSGNKKRKKQIATTTSNHNSNSSNESQIACSKLKQESGSSTPLQAQDYCKTIKTALNLQTKTTTATKRSSSSTSSSITLESLIAKETEAKQCSNNAKEKKAGESKFKSPKQCDSATSCATTTCDLPNMSLTSSVNAADDDNDDCLSNTDSLTDLTLSKVIDEMNAKQTETAPHQDSIVSILSIKKEICECDNLAKPLETAIAGAESLNNSATSNLISAIAHDLMDNDEYNLVEDQEAENSEREASVCKSEFGQENKLEIMKTETDTKNVAKISSVAETTESFPDLNTSSTIVETLTILSRKATPPSKAIACLSRKSLENESANGSSKNHEEISAFKEDSKENNSFDSSSNLIQKSQNAQECFALFSNSQSTQCKNANNPENQDLKSNNNNNFALPKYSLHSTGSHLVGKQRIRFIEEQMRLCREEYAKLKSEVAEIDRKKKKLKRNTLVEKSGSNVNVTAAPSCNEDSKKNYTLP